MAVPAVLCGEMFKVVKGYEIPMSKLQEFYLACRNTIWDMTLIAVAEPPTKRVKFSAPFMQTLEPFQESSLELPEPFFLVLKKQSTADSTVMLSNRTQ